jgi:glycosyltransferase involved in cell wall biosynthesis
MLQGDTRSDINPSDPSLYPRHPRSNKFITSIFIVRMPSVTAQKIVHVVETNGWHDEVFVALISNLSRYAVDYGEALEIHLFVKVARFQSTRLLKSMFPLIHIHPLDDWTLNYLLDHQPDMCFLNTGERDIFSVNKQLGNILRNGWSKLFCVVHRPHRVAEQIGTEFRLACAPWAKVNRLAFILLNSKTEEYFRNVEPLPLYKIDDNAFDQVEVHQFPPSFQISSKLLDVPQNSFDDVEPTYRFCIVGFIHPKKDYDRIFSELSSLRSLQRNIKLLIVGHSATNEAPLSIPANLRDLIEHHDSLSYPEFYSLLRSCNLIIPAFRDGEGYYENVASAVIPTSLIAETPLLGNPEIARCYDYLGSDTMFMARDGETEVQSIKRYIQEVGLEEQFRYRDALRQRNEQVMKANSQRIQKWL